MGRQRRTFTPEFRAKVALAAIRGEMTASEMTASEIASKFELHPVQVAQWKKQALDGLPSVLEDRRGKRGAGSEDQAALVDELYRQIGQLKVELDWLKKKSGELGRG